MAGRPFDREVAAGLRPLSVVGLGLITDERVVTGVPAPALDGLGWVGDLAPRTGVLAPALDVPGSVRDPFFSTPARALSFASGSFAARDDVVRANEGALATVAGLLAGIFTGFAGITRDVLLKPSLSKLCGMSSLVFGSASVFSGRCDEGGLAFGLLDPIVWDHMA